VTLSHTKSHYSPILTIKITNQKEIKKMNPFVSFMASPAGRITRIVAGIALIVWGLIGLTGVTGIVVAVIGALPLVAGIFDFCVFALLFGAPLSGPKIRAGK
jgi:hypothetical protein